MRKVWNINKLYLRLNCIPACLLASHLHAKRNMLIFPTAFIAAKPSNAIPALSDIDPTLMFAPHIRSLPFILP